MSRCGLLVFTGGSVAAGRKVVFCFPLRLAAHHRECVSGATHLLRWSDSLLGGTQLGLNFYFTLWLPANYALTFCIYSWDWSVAVEVGILSRAGIETEVGIFTNAYIFVMLLQTISVILFCPWETPQWTNWISDEGKLSDCLVLFGFVFLKRSKNESVWKVSFLLSRGNYYSEYHSPESGDLHFNSFLSHTERSDNWNLNVFVFSKVRD